MDWILAHLCAGILFVVAYAVHLCLDPIQSKAWRFHLRLFFFLFFFFKEEISWAHYCVIKLNKCFEPFLSPNMSAFKMKTEIMQLWNTSDFIQTNGTTEMNYMTPLALVPLEGLEVCFWPDEWLTDCCGAGGLWVELLFGVLRFHTGGVQVWYGR